MPPLRPARPLLPRGGRRPARLSPSPAWLPAFPACCHPLLGSPLPARRHWSRPAVTLSGVAASFPACCHSFCLGHPFLRGGTRPARPFPSARLRLVLVGHRTASRSPHVPLGSPSGHPSPGGAACAPPRGRHPPAWPPTLRVCRYLAVCRRPARLPQPASAAAAASAAARPHTALNDHDQG